MELSGTVRDPTDCFDENVYFLGSEIDLETIQEKHQGELLAVETQLRDEIDELKEKYESETAVKQALHDQVKFLLMRPLRRVTSKMSI